MQAFSAGPVRIGTAYSVLRDVLLADVSLAICQRDWPSLFLDYAQRLTFKLPSDWNMAWEGDVWEMPLAIEAAFPQASHGEKNLRITLLEEIERLGHIYSSLIDNSRIKVELSVQAQDGCRYFHVDYVGLRLIVTYAGPGTEWLFDADAERAGLGRRDNSQVIKCENKIQHLQPGWIALMKGERWPGHEGRGLIHRSPPIEAQGLRRLILTINAA